MSRGDEKILFDFLMLGGPNGATASRPMSPAVSPRTGNSTINTDDDAKIKRAQFNLKQLDKVIDFFSKEYYQKQIEINENKAQATKQLRELQKRSLNVNPNTTLELLLVQLQ